MTDTPHSPLHMTRRALILAPLSLPFARTAHAATPLPEPIPLPETPAGEQLGWILDQVERSGETLTDNRIESRFTPTFLTGLPADQLIAVLRDYVGPAGPLSVVRFEGPVDTAWLSAIALNPLGVAWRIRIGVGADEPHRIAQLFFEPVGVQSLPAKPPTNWPRLESAIAHLAPRASFAAAELTSTGPRWLSRLHGENQRAIASLFKIYVLGALTQAIEDGNAAWEESLSISSHARSLPNGDMRLETPGRAFPLRTYAEHMIASSDNTATDHLIIRIGRSETQSAFARMGHSHPDANDPLLLTREWFAMRLRFRDTQMDRFVAATPANRLRILTNTVDPLADSLSDDEPWPGPRYIDQVEWFAGASDIVRALAWIQTASADSSGIPALNALSISPGICWSPMNWAYVGYKGGYETGVMSNAWLLRRQDGRWFAVASIINDTRKEINAASFWQLLAVAEHLLAREP